MRSLRRPRRGRETTGPAGIVDERVLAVTIDDVVSKVTDPYERQARLYPALLALLPLLAMLGLLYAPATTALAGTLTVLVSCGGLYFMTSVCREFGKRLEERLYGEWGGKPSTLLLRHRDRTIESVTKLRYHAFLAAKIGRAFPDSEQETQNPEKADDLYQSGVRWLLNHTRPDDTKRFDLLLKENISYGFRRNALGIKPMGLTIAVGCLLWVLVRQALILFTSACPFNDIGALWRLPENVAASLIVSVAMLAAWLFFFTKATVRTAAFTYAETLLRACDVLER